MTRDLILLVLIATLQGCSPGTPPSRSTTRQVASVPSPPSAQAAPLPSLPSLPREASAEPALGETGPARCPEGMVHVEGEYCPQVEHKCQKYLDPPGRYHEYRCAAYDPPRCTSSRVRMSFCIDAREYTPAGQTLPSNRVSFRDATRTCGEMGKRVCTESEWNFACEGEAMRPYPYGDRRDAKVCHADRTDLWEEDGRTVRDQRVPSGSLAGCVSPFGVFDMAGNVEVP